MGLLENLKGSHTVQEQEAADRIEHLELHLRLIKNIAMDYLDKSVIATIHQVAKEGLAE